MKASKRQKLIALLVLRKGYTLEESRSTKYLHFRHLHAPASHGFWLGKAGAIRVGRTATASVSISDVPRNEWHELAEKYWQTLDAAEQKSIVERYP